MTLNQKIHNCQIQNSFWCLSDFVESLSQLLIYWYRHDLQIHAHVNFLLNKIDDNILLY